MDMINMEIYIHGTNMKKGKKMTAINPSILLDQSSTNCGDGTFFCILSINSEKFPADSIDSIIIYGCGQVGLYDVQCREIFGILTQKNEKIKLTYI